MEIFAVLGGIGLIAVILILVSISRLIVICQPNEVVIFSGPEKRPDQTIGYRHLRGGRGLRIPLLERVDRLDLTNMSVDVSVTGAYTRDGVPINVQGVANLKVDGDPPGLDRAVERLLGKPRDYIMRIARETLEGNLRGVLAKLTPEQVNEDKEKFAEELIEEAEVDFGKLGLVLDTLKIQTVSDDVEYLDSIGRVVNAELIRRARTAEAERKSEAAVQAANNLSQTRVAQLEADIAIARAEAQKRIITATSRRPAEVARERSVIEAQIARSEGELKVQAARIEQVKLQLDADVVAPARAYKARKQAEAQAQVAAIKENGLATAAGLRELAHVWLEAGDSARDIFLLEKLRGLVNIMVNTVSKVEVDQITMVGGAESTGGQVASLVEQLRSAADIDLPELVKRLGVGAKATQRKAAPKLPLQQPKA